MLHHQPKMLSKYATDLYTHPIENKYKIIAIKVMEHVWD